MSFRSEDNMTKSYRSIEEFAREELHSDNKVGFNMDDLMHESEYSASPLLFDDQFDEYDPANYDDNGKKWE